jgi:uncharacterized protein (TIGR03083 family)
MTKATDSLDADRAELLRICSGLSAADWQAGSGCDGWTVRDLVAHMGALFWLVVDPGKLPDVTGLPTERAQDVYVTKRRSLSPQEVVADYESVSAAALPILASLDGQDFELPLGDLGTYQASLVPTAYSFDHYVHIRMDLFAPRGPLAGEPPPGDEVRLAPTLDWIAAALPQQNAGILSALPGAIGFVISGPGARQIEVGTGDRLGQVSIAAPEFVRAITQRAGWDSASIEPASIEATSGELTPALLSRLKVF